MAGPFSNVGELKKEILKLLAASSQKRPKVGAIIRLLVYLRDELRCVYCREDFSGKSDSLTLDHVVPSSKGGGSHLDNLVTSCKRCNEKKGDSLFSEKAISLIASLTWQANKRFLKHLEMEPDALEILESVIASVEKRVFVFWQGQQHVVLEWHKGFMLRNMHTGECLKINPSFEKPEPGGEGENKKKRRLSAYERLEKIMKILGVTPEDING